MFLAKNYRNMLTQAMFKHKIRIHAQYKKAKIQLKKEGLFRRNVLLHTKKDNYFTRNLGLPESYFFAKKHKYTLYAKNKSK